VDEFIDVCFSNGKRPPLIPPILLLSSTTNVNVLALSRDKCYDRRGETEAKETFKDGELMALAQWSSPMHKSVCHTQLLPLGFNIVHQLFTSVLLPKGKPIVLPRLSCPPEFYHGVRQPVSGMYIFPCIRNHWLQHLTGPANCFFLGEC